MTANTATLDPSHGNELSPFAFLRPELDRVESRIRAQATAFDPAVEPYVAYILNTSGKRIRPALAFLSGGATGEVTDAHHAIPFRHDDPGLARHRLGGKQHPTQQCRGSFSPGHEPSQRKQRNHQRHRAKQSQPIRRDDLSEITRPCQSFRFINQRADQ